MHGPSVKINRPLTTTRVRRPYWRLQTEFFPLEFMDRELWSERAMKPTEKKILILQCLSEDGDGSENVASKVNALSFLQSSSRTVLRATCMIASGTYELALKRPGCVNLHEELPRDPFWDRPYLMCTSTICLAFQITAPVTKHATKVSPLQR